MSSTRCARGGFILHIGHLRSGILRQGASVTARVDAERRAGILRAHSATHMLHHALRTHLGAHAQQQGSKVDRDWLRFDFPNPRPLSREDLHRIEAEVNARVASAVPVEWTTMPIADARKLGAMMLFGEKYPDVVRVVSMGDFSKELCGGTHLTNTGQAGLFKIVGEESVAAGTRRITALTGPAALQKVQEEEAILAEVAATLKIPVSEVPARVAALAKEVRELKKQPARGPAGEEVSADKLLAGAEDISGTKVIVAEVPGGTPANPAPVDRSDASQGNADGRAVGESRGRQGGADRGRESRPSSRRGSTPASGSRPWPRSSAAAAAVARTWPRPAARIPRNCRRPWSGPARRFTISWRHTSVKACRIKSANAFSLGLAVSVPIDSPRVAP